jgi:1-acyl-sn-glycerol-3-phosphate acyltransferase
VTRLPRVRRRRRLGFSFRLAVAILWPFFRTTVKWDVRGAEELAAIDGGVIVAPNHLSWFDPPVVAYALWEADQPPRFLGKESVFRIPLFGRLISGAGQIPVYRETADASAAIRAALAALQAGECVVVYPEGTITRDPDVWPKAGKTGAVRMALMSGKPLVPMAQWGPNLVIGPYRKEFRLLPRKTMRIRFGAPIDLSDLGTVDGHALGIATDRLMDAITALLADARGEPPPARPAHRDDAPASQDGPAHDDDHRTDENGREGTTG